MGSAAWAATPAVPPELRTTSSWAAPNANLAGTRAATGERPRARDVDQIRRIWRFPIPEEPTFSGVMSATPLVLDGRVYLQSLSSNVYALDAATGTLAWSHRFGKESGGPNGLAAGYGRLYGATDTGIFALDRRTGRLLWSRRIAAAGSLVDIAPAVARGIVFAGTTAQAPGSAGSLVALDVASGRIRWRVDTVPGGFAHPRIASGGGVWWTPTIDRRGGLWAGTANPLPWGGSRALPNGGAYRGAARHTDSLLALGATDGRLRWFDQVTSHDVRDYDFALPPMLARLDGRDLVIGSGKGGRVIAWNRATRQRVWSAAVGVHRNDTGPLPRRQVSVCPGLLGGVLTPMALAGGRVFVPVVDLCMRGSSVGYEQFTSIDYERRGRGELVALDAATGARRWTRRFPSPVFGCATAAGDVVFTTTYAGRVYALSQQTGRTLWSVGEPAGSNACPAVAGNLLVVPAGAQPSSIATPTPVVDGYSLGPAPNP
jgi:outer membrane protein assembly factor BamB